MEMTFRDLYTVYELALKSLIVLSKHAEERSKKYGAYDTVAQLMAKEEDYCAAAVNRFYDELHKV